VAQKINLKNSKMIKSIDKINPTHLIKCPISLKKFFLHFI